MGFSQFFVRRPIFAGVLSAIIFIAGALSLRLLPISEYPEVVPPTVVVRATYPGRQPAGHRGDRRRAARAGDQRRRGHALHVVAVDGRRPDDADRHVRARHRPRQGAGARAEPRRADPAEAARGHAAARRRRPRRRRPISRWSCTWSRPDNRYDMLYLAELRARCACATSSRASTASARRGCSAPATTRCACGSTRRRSRR